MSTVTKCEAAYKAGPSAVVEYYLVPTTPAGLEVVDQREVHGSLVALEQPAQRTEPSVVAEFACTTSPMVLDQQQS